MPRVKAVCREIDALGLHFELPYMSRFGPSLDRPEEKRADTLTANVGCDADIPQHGQILAASSMERPRVRNATAAPPTRRPLCVAAIGPQMRDVKPRRPFAGALPVQSVVLLATGSEA